MAVASWGGLVTRETGVMGVYACPDHVPKPPFRPPTREAKVPWRRRSRVAETSRAFHYARRRTVHEIWNYDLGLGFLFFSKLSFGFLNYFLDACFQSFGLFLFFFFSFVIEREFGSGHAMISFSSFFSSFLILSLPH